MPLVEPRSATSQSPVELRRSSACFRETFGSARTQSHSRERPSEATGPSRTKRRSSSETMAFVSVRCAVRLVVRDWRLRLRRHLVDHRVALLALRRRLAFALRRLDQAGLDAELAEAQALVDLQAHLGAGEEREVVPASVLEEVRGELLLERALVALEALVVLRRRARPCTGWARRRARPRRSGARPSPSRACARSPRAGPRDEKARENAPWTRFSIRASRFRRTLISILLAAREIGRAAPPPAARVEPGILASSVSDALVIERGLGAGERPRASGLVAAGWRRRGRATARATTTIAMAALALCEPSPT